MERQISKERDKIEEIQQLEKGKLTNKQKLFCIYYVKYFNATRAYLEAYKSSYKTANASGSRMLVNVSIQQEIQRLKASKLKGAYLEPEDLLQKYIDIAFSDITDYVEFGTETYTKIDEDTGEERHFKSTHINFKDSSAIDGTIISEVSKGKDGIKIKLQDKMKALDFLSKNIGLLSVEDKQKLTIAREKLKNEQGQNNNTQSEDLRAKMKARLKGVFNK